MSLYRAFAKIASLTMVSRILGFIRDILHTAILGASFISDAFIVAFKFPNFFRRLFGEGAFNAAFIPLFSSMLASKGKQAALEFAAQSLALLAAMLVLVVGLAETFMPAVMAMLAPGFVDEPDRYQAAIDFGRITFPYLFFISLASLYVGVLNSFHKFAVGAAAPILLNLCMIAGLLIYENDAFNTGYAVSAAVSVAGVLQLLWLVWATHKNDIKIRLILPKLTPETKKLLIKMGPVALSGSIFQVNLLVDVILASFLPKGAVTYLYFADRLSELPLGVIGVTIGTALLPILSKHVELHEKEHAFDTQHKSLTTGMMFAIPAAIALAVIADPIIRVLFGRGAFTDVDVIATATTLMAYAFGVPAFVLNKVFTTSFFAHKDTKTPLKIGLVSIALNFTLNIILMQYYSYVGLAMSTTIAAWVQALMNYMTLHKRDWYRFNLVLLKRMAIFLFGGALMSGYLILCYAQNYLTQPLLLLIISVLGGMIVYGLGLLLAGFRPSQMRG